MASFRSLSDLRRHLQLLQPADGLSTTGAWTSGQIFFHLAAAFEASSETSSDRVSGASRVLKAPLRFFVLRGWLPRGVPIPKQVRDRLTPPPDAVHAVQLDRLLHAVNTFESLIQRDPRANLPLHPVVGRLTCDEWLRFHLRHCELHLGHIVFTAVGD